MAKDDVIEIEGIVIDALPNAMFTVDIGNSEHCIRQRIDYDALNLDYVVFCQVVNLPGCSLAFPWRGTPGLFVIRC